jgi:hemerythrin-like metal-binding protein
MASAWTKMPEEVAVNQLSWSYACAVGVRAMDDQHGILMDSFNELQLALKNGAGQEKVSQLVDRLIEFTRMHFWNEEQLMEQQGFESLAAHRAKHRALLAEMLGWAHGVQYGRRLEVAGLLGRFREVFLEHIAMMDREYGTWLNARGVF